MKPADHILLAHLLREREAAFVTVWECERGIRQRLHGAEFAFPAPPELPSRRRRAAPVSAPPRRAAAAVRRLRPGEDAYRLTGLREWVRCEALADSQEVVRALGSGAAPEFTLLRVETVALDAAGVPTVVDCLWSVDPPEGAADTPSA